MLTFGNSFSDQGSYLEEIAQYSKTQPAEKRQNNFEIDIMEEERDEEVDKDRIKEKGLQKFLRKEKIIKSEGNESQTISELLQIKLKNKTEENTTVTSQNEFEKLSRRLAENNKHLNESNQKLDKKFSAKQQIIGIAENLHKGIVSNKMSKSENEVEHVSQLKIMSPKVLKRPIEIADFEKFNKDSQKRDIKRQGQTEIPYKLPFSPISNVMKMNNNTNNNLLKEKMSNNLQKSGAQIAQTMEMIVSLILEFLSQSSNNSIIDSQDHEKRKKYLIIGVSFNFLILTIILILKNKIKMTNKYGVLSALIKSLSILSFIECRLLPLIQSIRSRNLVEFQMSFLDLITIGSISFISFKELIPTKQDLLRSKKFTIFRSIICLIIGIYFTYIVGEGNIEGIIHFIVTNGVILASLFILSYNFPCFLKMKSTTTINPFDFSKNSNENSQVFSPRFGGGSGGYDQEITLQTDDQRGNCKIQQGDAVVAYFHQDTNQMSSDSDSQNKNDQEINSNKINNNKRNNHNNFINLNNRSIIDTKQSKQIVSPRGRIESLQFQSPRDLLDSERPMFSQNGQKDEGDEEIGALEKAALYAVTMQENTERENQNQDINVHQEIAEIFENTKSKEQSQGQLKVDDEDEEDNDQDGEEFEISCHEGQNISLFTGDRSDLASDSTNSSQIGIRKKKQTKKKKSKKNMDSSQIQNQEKKEEEFCSSEINQRLQLQDIILGNLNEGIIVIRHRNGEAVYANRQSCYLLQCSADEIINNVLSLRNILSFKNDIMNFSEIIQQFDKPAELSELLNVQGLYSNLHSKREMMICSLEIKDTQKTNQSDQFNENSFSINQKNNFNHNSSSDSQNASQMNQNQKSHQSTSVFASTEQTVENVCHTQDSQSLSPFQSNNKMKNAVLQPSPFNNGESSSIKSFFDKYVFIMVEMEIVQSMNQERFVIISLKKMGWNNPLHSIHQNSLKVQYFIRKMISEISVDLNDMKNYFISTRNQPNTSKIDVNGCLGKLECMAEFLQDFATSSLILSATFVPVKYPLNLSTLIESVVNKLELRTVSEAYTFKIEYEKSCPQEISSDYKRLERVFYNLLLYFVDTNESADILIKVQSLSNNSIPDTKRIKVILKCILNKQEKEIKQKNEPIPLSLASKKANITNVFMLENMHYGVLLSNSIIQKLEPSGQGVFFQAGYNISFFFKLSI